MKRALIKELSLSAAENGLSEKELDWIFSRFSRADLKLFMRLLAQDVKNRSVTAFYAGKLEDAEKKRVEALFPGKEISFKQDDENITGGVRFEYGDFVLDYSLSGIVSRILSHIKE